MTAVLLFAHGSPVAEANEGIATLARQVAERLGAGFVLPAFLDSSPPDLGMAMEEAVRRGARRVVIMPYFLTMGLHLRRDLPVLVARQRARFPGLEILVSDSLEGLPGMVDAVADRVREALARNERPAGRSMT